MKIFLFIWMLYFHSIKCDVQISTNDLELTKGDKENIFLEIKYYNKEVKFIVQHDDIVGISPKTIPAATGSHKETISIEALGAGHCNIYADDTNDESLKDVFVRVTVNKVPALDTISVVIGWIYFVAWSISFYPQIYENFKRKSVVGLNFDFLALNVIGFSLYSTFNIGLYSSDAIKNEYFDRNPRGLNPVQLNDIFFSVHAVFASLITILQCFIYEREDQRVSLTARGIIGIFFVFITGSILLCAFSDVIDWLDVLYYCSYVKLTITLIKYIPQAYMNYKRKSTIGWSIGNIFLDFTGGTLSMLQMIINAFNYDDWASIFGDPTKFGLGFFSVIFDVFFIVQHYILYRHSNYEENT